MLVDVNTAPVPPRRGALPAALPGPPPPLLAALAAALVIGPMLLGLWLQRAELDLLRALGVGTGLLALALLLTQFLSSGRFEALSGKTGIDRTMQAHQWAGRALLALALAHPLLLSLPEPGDAWSRLPETVAALASMRPMRSGTAALLLLVLLVGWSLVRRRLQHKWPHEIWRAAHLLLALAAAATAAHHALTVGVASSGALRPLWWLLLALAAAAVLWVHALRPLALRRQPWTIEANREVADGIRELTLRAAHAPRPFLPGQFAWLDIGRVPVPLRDHPFSIASAPQALPTLRFLIKARGDFTGALARLPVGAVAHLDYPHGSFTPLARDWDRLLLVAGGIGVAPMFSILRALAAAGETRPVTLAYGVNRVQDLVGRDELNAMTSTLALDLHLFVDQPTGDPGADPVLRPRAELLPTLAAVARAAQAAGRHGLLAMICGPVGMPRAVEAVLRAEGVPRHAVVYERFDYD
jgi:predicted ferric reductase